MKKYPLFFILLSLFFVGTSQAQDWSNPFYGLHPFPESPVYYDYSGLSAAFLLEDDSGVLLTEDVKVLRIEE